MTDMDEAFAHWISDLNDLYASASEAEIRERLKDYRATVAHELAEKQRSRIPDGRSLSGWHRHVLYGLAGETFEARDALNDYTEAITEELAGLIDPKATP